MGHAGVIHLQREEVHTGIRLGRGHDVLALAGTDLHDKRIGVAPHLAHILPVERESLTYVQRPFSGIDVEQVLA